MRSGDPFSSGITKTYLGHLFGFVGLKGQTIGDLFHEDMSGARYSVRDLGLKPRRIDVVRDVSTCQFKPFDSTIPRRNRRPSTPRRVEFVDGRDSDYPEIGAQIGMATHRVG